MADSGSRYLSLRDVEGQMSTFPALIYPTVSFNSIVISCLLHIFSDCLLNGHILDLLERIQNKVPGYCQGFSKCSMYLQAAEKQNQSLEQCSLDLLQRDR